jgi:hypothetical protein
LQLLVAPERGQPVDRLTEHIAATSRRRSKVEQGSIGIEDASLHAG